MMIFSQVEKILSDLERKSLRRDLICLPSAINLSSNDYLALHESHLPQEFIKSLNHAPQAFSSSASRSIYGLNAHFKLEQKLGKLYGKKALLFSSGYGANLGVLGALSTLAGIIFVVDEAAHASIFHGIAKARFARFRHNDMGSLRDKLRLYSSKYSAIIISEGLFSMDGDFCDYDALIALKREFNALLFIDATHSLCTRSSCMLGVENVPEIDFISIGFGKALCSFGGAILANDLFIEFFINMAKTLLFSTALPPINTAWTLFVLKNMPFLESRAQSLQKVAKEIKDEIANLGYEVRGEAHILSLITGDSQSALSLAHSLGERGVFARAIRAPSVKAGSERVRLCLNAKLEAQSLLFALRDLK